MGRNKVQLNPALSVKSETGCARINFGTTKHHRQVIRDAPAWLAGVLEQLNTPMDLEEAVARAAHANPDAPIEDIALALRDLIISGVVMPVRDEHHRYSRHHLFFGLYGIEPRQYDVCLARATIGIVGMGGLGSTVAMLLAGAGIGELVISDGDELEESNLTRSLLYRERDIGRLKVDAATDQLRALNDNLKVRAVPSGFSGSELLVKHFSKCDLLVLTADKPAAVHQWMDEGAKSLGVPYLNAGYVETSAAVGPFVFPGRTACYECHQRTLPKIAERQLNEGLRAASYGPLNMLSAAIASHEVIRHLLGLNPATVNRWLLMNAGDFAAEYVPVPPHPDCDCGASKREVAAQRADLAKLYEEEREGPSLNREILDEPVVRRALRLGTRVLDLGCGIGTLARRLAAEGRQVTAVDVSPQMLDRCKRLTPPDVARSVRYFCGDIAKAEWPQGPYDVVLLILALDYLEDPAPTLARCREALAEGGRLLLALPHPMKDSGHWRDSEKGGEWVLDDYFSDGPQFKSRFDRTGRERLSGLRTYKRSLATTLELLGQTGFAIVGAEEPRPDEKAVSGAQRSKAARLPYFLLLECSVSGAKS